MPMLDIAVAGRTHSVQCDDGQEPRLRRLAGYVDSKATEVARKNPHLGDGRVLLLTSLIVADELFDAYEELTQLRAAAAQTSPSGMAGANDVLERVADRLDKLAAELANT